MRERTMRERRERELLVCTQNTAQRLGENVQPCDKPRPVEISPTVSRSRHPTVCDGLSVCGHASASGRHTSGLCFEYSLPSDTPPVGPRLDKVRAHTPAPAYTSRCFGDRNRNPESPALPMQSLAVSRSRYLTMCDGVSVCASVIVQDIRCFGYRNLTLETSSPSSQSSAVASPGPAKCCAIHLSPLPCSDLGQGVAISTTAFMLPRFFVQTHIFSVSPSSFSL